MSKMNFKEMAKSINASKINMDTFERVKIFQINDGVVVYLIENSDEDDFSVARIDTKYEVQLLAQVLREESVLGGGGIFKITAEQLESIYKIESEFFPERWGI